MTTEFEELQARLDRERLEFNFPAQLQTYKKLARVWLNERLYAKAAENLHKAAKVAGYLDESGTVVSILKSLIAVHEQADDLDGVIAAYMSLHIHYTTRDEFETATQINRIRLDLVAKRLGISDPTMEDRFQYEYERACIENENWCAERQRLIDGSELPTVPDEHYGACLFAVQDLLMESEFDAALDCIDTCEKTMRSQGQWATNDGIQRVSGLRELVEKRRSGNGRPDFLQ